MFSCTDEIREYFGSSVAIYFAFLGFYTCYLVLPAVFGAVSHYLKYFLDQQTVVPAFCIFNLIWVTVFLESWKRRTSELAYYWGTLRMSRFEEPRPTFYGTEVRKDPVTNRLQPYYPGRIRLLKVYLVSVPIMACALLAAFVVMLFYFWYVDKTLVAL